MKFFDGDAIMPKAQRNSQAIEAVKEEILAQAVDLIITDGYAGFSMRKLAQRLGFAAKTIYNYYQNKDELYLVILTRGFENLYERCAAAQRTHSGPLERIDAMVRAFLEFGLTESNFYNLMFTWHVPKYNDYRDTRMEPTARVELETALRVSELFIRAIRDCGDPGKPIGDQAARFLMIYFWIQLHGYIAGVNNTLLQYMHAQPLELAEQILEQIRKNFRNAVASTGKETTG